MTAEYRQELIRSFFDLYCLGTTQKSSLFENHLVKLRALVDTSFDFLKTKSAYSGFIDLIEIYMESNFKNPGKMSEVEISPSRLIQLAKSVVSKQHEGLISSLCTVLQSECSRQLTLQAMCALLTCYKHIYSYLVNGKAKKLETDLIIIKTLTEIYKTICKSSIVKLVYDLNLLSDQTDTISIALTESSLENKKATDKIKKEKDSISFSTITENKVIKLVVLVPELLNKEVYTFLTIRSELSIEKLVAAKYEHLYEENDEASLQQFTFVKAVIEYLVHANKEMVPQIDHLIQSMLHAFAKGIETVKASIKDKSKQTGMSAMLSGDSNHLEQTNSIMITKLHHEIDHMLLLLMKCVADQFGDKKLKVCSDIFMFWLLLSEKYRNNSLIRLLTNFYLRAEKKGLDLINPLTDSEIFYCSRYIKTVSRDIFGQENTDLVINILITLYIFEQSNTARTNTLKF